MLQALSTWQKDPLVRPSQSPEPIHKLNLVKWKAQRFASGGTPTCECAQSGEGVLRTPHHLWKRLPKSLLTHHLDPAPTNLPKPVPTPLPRIAALYKELCVILLKRSVPGMEWNIVVFGGAFCRQFGLRFQA